MQYADMIIEASNATLTLTPDNRRTGAFQIRVLSSPAGEMKPEEAVSIQYDDKQLQNDIQQLDLRELDQAGMIAFGSKLANWLLPTIQPGATSGIRDMYTRSLQQVGQDQGLRLRLRFPPQLAALPWEYNEVMQRSVAEASDIELAVSTIHLLGYYNTTVHFSLFYPKMRQRLAIGALAISADVASPKDFISQYTLAAVQFTQEAKFLLKDWTLPQ